MTEITTVQLNILHHTLGVTPVMREPYRNHFVAGPRHHDLEHLLALEAAGLMERAKPPKCLHSDDIVFVCTDAGRAYAIEHLPPAPKLSRYEEYLSAEPGCSFAEWLGIWPVTTDVRFVCGGLEYRMWRWGDDLCRTQISGDWSPTKKAAKESYKAALRASRSAGAAGKGV